MVALVRDRGRYFNPMPVIPTFSSYAPAPNLAEAYLGGGRLQLARQQLAQEAAADAARIALGRQQLQQRAIENEMQLAATKEAQARENLRKAQEAEVEKAYRETQLGLRARELQNEEAIATMRIADAAMEFDRAQRYQRRVSELMQTPGMKLEDAARTAILEAGGTGLSTALERPNPPSPYPGLNFEMSKLGAEERAITRRYPGAMALAIKPEDRAALEDIQRRRMALGIPASETNAPSTKRLRYNRTSGQFE